MTRKLALTAASATAALMMTASPAHATWWKDWHTHYCDCGHSTGKKSCGSSSSSGSSTTTTTGGSTTTSGSSTSGSSTTTTSGGSTSTGSTSGGTPVPEPGMLGMMGLGFIGLAVARRRRSRR